MVLRIKTTVLPEGKIEISDPRLRPGEDVDVIVLRPEAPAGTRRSAIEILSEAQGHRLFKSAEEVDAYLREERGAWDS